jgi:hypothetical protein
MGPHLTRNPKAAHRSKAALQRNSPEQSQRQPRESWSRNRSMRKRKARQAPEAKNSAGYSLVRSQWTRNRRWNVSQYLRKEAKTQAKPCQRRIGKKENTAPGQDRGPPNRLPGEASQGGTWKLAFRHIHTTMDKAGSAPKGAATWQARTWQRHPTVWGLRHLSAGPLPQGTRRQRRAPKSDRAAGKQTSEDPILKWPGSKSPELGPFRKCLSDQGTGPQGKQLPAQEGKFPQQPSSTTIPTRRS